MDDLRPTSAKCDDERLFVALSDGREITIPLWWYPRLAAATVVERNEIQVSQMGLHWPQIDEDISIDSIIRGERDPGAIDPSAPAYDLRHLFKPIELSPENAQIHDEEWIEGAHQRIDYRSLIHKAVADGRSFGQPIDDFDYDLFFAATDTLLDVGSLLHVAEYYPWPIDVTTGQLWLYGALQALSVQQDAMEQLLKCFNILIHPDAIEPLREITELRIAAVGHPQHHKSKKLKYKGCTWLAKRQSGSRTIFHIATLRDFKDFVQRAIDVPKLIARQQIAIQICLAQAWTKIECDPRFGMPS